MENEFKSNETRNDVNKIGIYILIFFIGCLVMYAVVYFFPTSITESITKLEKDVTVTDAGIADAVEKVYDAVVIVSTYQNEKYAASGTGFVYDKVDKKYHILTNYHVIEGGNKVTVTFTDGTIEETEIIGYDEYADIAVLAIETDKELAVAELGKSEDMRVGDTAFAVGAPLDSAYSWTVTRGILSGKDRMVEVSLKSSNYSSNDYVMKVVQTDAAINSGNSGGPLCNANGEVIGITSLKLVSSGVEGMGFAIPIETALEKAEQIIDGDKKDQPYLGVSMVDLSTAYLQYYKLIQESGLSNGVIVSDVVKNSPAEKAGIKSGDIIIGIEDEKVTNVAYLRYYLYQHNVGDKIKIKVYREKDEKTIEVTLGSNKETS